MILKARDWTLLWLPSEELPSKLKESGMVVQFDFGAFEILKIAERIQTISVGFAAVTDHNYRENITPSLSKQAKTE